MRVTAIVALSIALSSCEAAAPPPPSPADAVLIGEDVPRFWTALDEGRASGDLEGALESGYLAPGTQPLRVFVSRRIGSAAQLAQTVQSHGAYYDSIRASSLSLARGEGFWNEVQRGFEEIERIEPRAVFPPVAILVGRMNSGGTTTAEGITIGVELFAAGPDAVLSELTDDERARLGAPDRMAALVLHEHAHVLEESIGGLRSGDDRSLLERALFEGIADFVAETVVGQRPTSDETYAYGEANELALWNEFRTVMEGHDVTGWLYGPGTAARPRDLGYFVGHRIASHYAATRPDSDTAIRELLAATDAHSILDASGYDGTAL